MSQYGINWRQLRDQPDHKGTIVFFNKATGETEIGKVTKDVIDSSVLGQVAFEKALDQQWDLDIGTKPVPIQFQNLNFTMLKPLEDTALYTDIYLDGKYEPTLPLKFGVYYRLSTGIDNADITLGFDYSFVQDSSAVPSSYVLNPFTISPTADTDIHVAINAEIPAQTTINPRDMVSIRLSRNGSSDSSTEGFCILGMFIYQEALA